jgi:hypothetical protein
MRRAAPRTPPVMPPIAPRDSPCGVDTATEGFGELLAVATIRSTDFKRTCGGCDASTGNDTVATQAKEFNVVRREAQPADRRLKYST